MTDEWGKFLDARMELIKRFRKEGKHAHEIFDLLTVSPMQVQMLCLTADRENAKEPE